MNRTGYALTRRMIVLPRAKQYLVFHAIALYTLSSTALLLDAVATPASGTIMGLFLARRPRHLLARVQGVGRAHNPACSPPSSRMRLAVRDSSLW